jgi:hypothetical protein
MEINVKELKRRLAALTEEQKDSLKKEFLKRYAEREAEFARKAEKNKITSEFLNKEYTI